MVSADTSDKKYTTPKTNFNKPLVFPTLIVFSLFTSERITAGNCFHRFPESTFFGKTFIDFLMSILQKSHFFTGIDI